MTNDLVREQQAMLAGMKPTLKDGIYYFCTTIDADILAALSDRALALVRESEGTALVLAKEDAARHGFDLSMPMSRIVLEVFSALEGVGLTAGVATALADERIPCNMIAGYHHDNVFVPEHLASRAVKVLTDVQHKARSKSG
jgi:hypothetical protein